MDELDETGYKKLQEICDVLSVHGKYSQRYCKVESFKIKCAYQEKYRLINEEGDIWLYFMGCTDGTHAPSDFKESEWLMFYYKGFAVELEFEQQRGAPVPFKLKFVVSNGTVINELQMLLLEKGIFVDKYYHIMRKALNAQRPNYYEL